MEDFRPEETTPLREVPRKPECCAEPMKESTLVGPLGRVPVFTCERCRRQVTAPSTTTPKRRTT